MLIYPEFIAAIILIFAAFIILAWHLGDMHGYCRRQIEESEEKGEER